MHGIADSSDAFIVNGKKGPAVIAAKEGYDVWLGNVRGNKYSRLHVEMDADSEKKFWDFSFPEIGL